MTDANVEVRITGSLDPSVAASVRTAASELNNLGSAASVSARTMSDALKSAGGDISKVTPAMLGLAGSATTLAPAATEAAVALETVGHSAVSSRAATESLVIVHEALQGRMTRIPGSAMILAQALTGAGGATLFMGAGVVALTAGLGYLAVKAIEAAKSLDDVKLGADFAGNTEISREKIQALIDQLDRLPGVSEKDAEKVVGSFARMRGMSEPEISALTTLIGDFARAHGEEITKAASQVGSALNSENITWKELQALVPNITQDQVDAIEKTQRLGNAHATAAAIIDLMRGSLAGVGTEIDRQNTSVTASIKNWFAYAFAAEAGIGADEVAAGLLAENTALREKNTAALKTQAQALRDLPAAKQLTDIPKAKTGAAAAPQSDVARERAEEERSFWQETRAEMLANEVGFWQQAVTATVAGTKDHTEAVRGMLQAEAQLHSASGEGAIAQMREQNAEILADASLAKSEQIQREIQAAQILLSTDKLTGDQRVEIQRAMADQIRELHDEQNRETKAALDKEVGLFQSAFDAELAARREQSRQMIEEIQKTAAPIAAAARLEKESQLAGLREISSAESTFTSQLLSGRVGVLGALQAAGTQFIEKEIQDDLRYFTVRALYGQAALAKDTSLGQAGVLLHSLLEGEKTAATGAGEAARLATKESARAAASAVEVASGSAEILNDAYRAAAGTYAAVAQIPYVGPYLAPIAAGVAFAAVAGYDKLTGLETGTMNVRQTGPYLLHEGEMVAPKPFAQGMRESIGSGGFGGGISNVANGGDTHIQFTHAPTIHAPQNSSIHKLIKDQPGEFISAFMDLVRGGYLKPV